MVVGERMALRLRELGIEPKTIRVIPNWADGERIMPIEREPKSAQIRVGPNGDDFVVSYAGNLGRAHEIETLLDAMQALEPNHLQPPHPTIRFVFIGGGALRAKLGERGETT